MSFPGISWHSILAALDQVQRVGESSAYEVLDKYQLRFFIEGIQPLVLRTGARLYLSEGAPVLRIEDGGITYSFGWARIIGYEASLEPMSEMLSLN